MSPNGVLDVSRPNTLEGEGRPPEQAQRREGGRGGVMLKRPFTPPRRYAPTLPFQGRVGSP